MKNISKILVIMLLLSSCINDLDRAPFIEVTSAKVYADASSYKQVLAKIYAGYAVSGQQGPSGQPDISGIDEGFSSYLRQYWKAQELTTDEAIIGWNDGNLRDYHDMDWTANNEFVTAMYNRIYYQITLCNEFIRETSAEKLAERKINNSDIKVFRAEARFLRALSYYHALDMFGSVPFITDADAVGSFLPKQTSRASLFAYVEKELKEVEVDLAVPATNEYGRADKAAAWTVLAKLYLNAQVYVGSAKNNECIDYCNKIIAAGYSLEPKYENLFMADNHKSKEIIFPIAFDGVRTKTYGGMTFLVHAPVGGAMNPALFGINGGWSGLRTTKSLVEKYSVEDKRGVFFKDGQNLDIDDIFKFTEGFAISKFKNVDSNGKPGSDIEGNFVDTDFPMFRLADVYLMQAEAILRGGTNGNLPAAIVNLNKLRDRAYGANKGNVSSIDLNYILDERARELHWEGHRRTDLIRFSKFSGGTYIWSWKGGTKEGKSVADNLNLFPIPSSDLIANPNLKQNTGY